MTAQIVTAEPPEISAYVDARTAVVNELKRRYRVSSASELLTAVSEDDEKDFSNELCSCFEGINVFDLAKLDGVAAAIAFVIAYTGEEDDVDEVDIERGSIFCDAVSNLASHLQYRTQAAACEYVTRLFGKEAGIKFSEEFEGVDLDMNELALAWDKRVNEDIEREIAEELTKAGRPVAGA